VSKAKEQAQKFVEQALAHGFRVVVANDNVVRIVRSFNPGDKEAFTHCDMVAGSVLDLAPLRGGSVWGTDGGSVGGMSALNSGMFVMNKSGEAKSFMKALRGFVL
jgi:hypothetical protein